MTMCCCRREFDPKEFIDYIEKLRHSEKEVRKRRNEIAVRHESLRERLQAIREEAAELRDAAPGIGISELSLRVDALLDLILKG